MPQVRFYRDDDGKCPFLEWVLGLPEKAQDKVYARLEVLEELGHNLRRPLADILRDGIHELRVSRQGVHHRVLYFFHGRDAVVLTHGLEKKSAVPDREIELALRRKRAYEADPEQHTYVEEEES